MRSRVDQEWVEKGDICSVTEIATAVWQSSALVARPLPSSSPGTLVDKLNHWGHGWLWDNLEVTGNGLWLNEAILSGSCIAAADGLFMKEAHPHLCSTAFTLECTKGRGVITGSFAEFTSVTSAF
jgi:hypothetical protein